MHWSPQNEIWRRSLYRSGLVLSHCGTHGKEQADKAPNNDPTKEQRIFEATRSETKWFLRWIDLPGNNAAEVYKEDGKEKYPRDRDLDRSEQTNILSLRSGHHPDLREWRATVGRNEEAGSCCRACKWQRKPLATS